MSKRFGIDIDGTVTCPTSLIPHINEAFDRRLSLDDLTEYDLTKALPDISPEVFSQWFLKAEPSIYSSSPVVQYADEILEQWRSDHELFFISARSDKHIDLTMNWFLEKKIGYDHIELIGSHDKVKTAQKFNVDIFFEDKHDNAVMIHEECAIPVILFDTPYNRSPIPDGVIRVNNWLDAKKWVNNWILKTT
ncbi:nucleotidase [Jeotgalibacillus campisalis]|uniref:Nucleotidase n=1 Tax=Jeotgalibacillus campisalis TaxID=220754 RepID=A0A0C2R714_9BACL|nr:nucleotidase [Jeotgalibacillus campisalis]KIL46010.1 nucleotidase [Jeotgalibacillus campisalis]